MIIQYSILGVFLKANLSFSSETNLASAKYLRFLIKTQTEILLNTTTRKLDVILYVVFFKQHNKHIHFSNALQQ